MTIENILIQTDRILSYVPLLSIPVNLTDLFIKNVVIPKTNYEDVQKNSYYKYLIRKNDQSCVTLLIPVLGPILVKASNHRKWKDPKFVRNQVSEDGLQLQNVHSSLKRDLKIISLALKQNPEAAKYISKDFLLYANDALLDVLVEDLIVVKHLPNFIKDDAAFMKALVEKESAALQYASRSFRGFKGDGSFFRDCVCQDPSCFQYGNTNLANDENFLKSVCPVQPSIFEESSSLIRQDQDLILYLLSKNLAILDYINQDLLKDASFLKSVLKASKLAQYELDEVLFYVDLKDDKDFMSEALLIDKRFLSHIDPAWFNDASFLLKIIRKDLSLLEEIDSSLLTSRKFLLEAIIFNVDVLCYADKNLLDNIDFMLSAFASNSASKHYATDRLKHDQRFIDGMEKRLKKNEEVNQMVWSAVNWVRENS